ncbi:MULTISPECIES: bestrophin-like domain [unclassified Bradyrhizobium]
MFTDMMEGAFANMMNLLISLLVFALIFGGALAGMAVRPLLSEHHLQSDSKDVVKLTAGLIGTLTALVLGLLIASAKTTFDQKASQVRQLTATIILLDDLVTQYGSEATPVRKLLRQSIPPMADRIWHEQANSNGKPTRFESSVEAWTFYDELERLSPNNDMQRSLQTRAIAAFTEGAQMRLRLFTQAGSSIPTPFLIIMVFWLSAIFVSATLFVRANIVVTIALFVCALSFAGAIFLVLELDDPFTGLMGISSSTLRSALPPLNS